MTSLNSKLQLAMLNRKKGRNWIEKGFTLVELMIVIVIVGVLSATALPNFLGTKAKAEAGAMNGSLVGLAKECASNAILDSPDDVSADGATNITFVEGVTGTNCASGAKISNTAGFTADEIGGAKCGDSTTVANGSTHTHCVVTISTDGATTYAWGAAGAS